MSTRQPCVSVIIPAYNYARFLPLAVQSALQQRGEDFSVEVIVVDDGSTDDTAEVAAGLAGIRYIHQENQGLSAARNTGMLAARGDFLLFLDADDLLAPQVVSYHKTLNLSQKLKNAVLYTILFPIPTYIMIIFAFGAYALLAINSPIVTILIGMLLIALGMTFTFLIMTNYADHNSENVLQTLYENLKTEQSRKERKEKKKKDVKPTQPVKYKKKK